MGLSFYISNDIFAWAVMSQIIQIPTRAILYKKERLSGMYSSHAFYCALWVSQTLMLLSYPILVTVGSYYFLDLADQSSENFWSFVLTGFLICQVGSNFGFMWGSIVYKED